MRKSVNTCVLVLLLAWVPVAAQSVRYTVSPINAEQVLKEENFRKTIDFLTDPATGGRAMGSEGSRKVAAWLDDQFHVLGLYPLSGAWQHGFNSGGVFGRNVMGLIPGATSRYVIVMAHYDNLGQLGGSFYPGADSNASGVAAMLSLAEMVRTMQDLGKGYAHSVLFVALDGKEQGLSGAEHLWNLLEDKRLQDPFTGAAIGVKDIDLVLNIDQVGSTLSPIRKGRSDYLLMMSDARDGRREVLASANRNRRLDLDIAFDYYGSKDFTTLFYRRISDQRIFLEHGVPAVMFTSGITLNNNKPYDNAASLDYAVLRKRIILMFNYLSRIL